MHLDKSIGGGDGAGGIFVFVVRIGQFDLRLLRETAIGVTRLQLLIIIDRFLVTPRIQLGTRFGVEFLRRPALGFVGFVGQQAARRQLPTHEQREKYGYTMPNHINTTLRTHP